MIGTVCLLAAAAIGAWWYWRAVVRPRHLHGAQTLRLRDAWLGEDFDGALRVARGQDLCDCPIRDVLDLLNTGGSDA